MEGALKLLLNTHAVLVVGSCSSLKHALKAGGFEGEHQIMRGYQYAACCQCCCGKPDAMVSPASGRTHICATRWR